VLHSLDVQRKRSELNNSWQLEANQLRRSEGAAYQAAAAALQTAVLKTAEMASDERRNLNKVIAQIGACAQVLLPTIGQFADSYLLEVNGPTALDALALACILDDARKLDASTGRALLALDQKAISATIAEELKGADIKVFGTPHQLAPWLASKGVTLSVAAGAVERRDADDRGNT